MTLLMEAGMVNGEEVSSIESDYVQASCLVTSSTDRMSFATGESESASRTLRAEHDEMRHCEQTSLLCNHQYSTILEVVKESPTTYYIRCGC